MFLTAFKLMFANPGPSKVLRPRLPAVPDGGSGKSEALNRPEMNAPRDAET